MGYKVSANYAISEEAVEADKEKKFLEDETTGENSRY